MKCVRIMLLVAGCSLPTLAGASAQRTFVASTGVDTNPCSIVAPCRGFARALTQTSAGGEVIVQDSAGYGPVAIAQSVSIIAPAGIYAGISVVSGDGITINGAGIRVVLRGLAITGLGGQIGIDIVSAADVDIADCTVSGLSTSGLKKLGTGDLSIRDSIFHHNGHGIDHQGGSGTLARVVSRENVSTGVLVDASTVAMTGSTLEKNGGPGLIATGASHVTVHDSLVQRNADNGVTALDGYLRISNSVITVNGAYAVSLVGNAEAWLVGNNIHDNGQTSATAEVCLCSANTALWLNGNTIASAALHFPIDTNLGTTTTYGNNSLAPPGSGLTTRSRQ